MGQFILLALEKKSVWNNKHTAELKIHDMFIIAEDSAQKCLRLAPLNYYRAKALLTLLSGEHIQQMRQESFFLYSGPPQ